MTNVESCALLLILLTEKEDSDIVAAGSREVYNSVSFKTKCQLSTDSKMVSLPLVSPLYAH